MNENEVKTSIKPTRRDRIGGYVSLLFGILFLYLAVMAPEAPTSNGATSDLLAALVVPGLFLYFAYYCLSGKQARRRAAKADKSLDDEHRKSE
jgi:lipopolysaccharide export LptBFGC system permease protein LptF